MSTIYPYFRMSGRGDHFGGPPRGGPPGPPGRGRGGRGGGPPRFPGGNFGGGGGSAVSLIFFSS